jgi:hypothetical protein
MLRFQVAYDIYLQSQVYRALKGSDNALSVRPCGQFPLTRYVVVQELVSRPRRRVAVEKYAHQLGQIGSQNVIAIEPTNTCMFPTICSFCVAQKNRLNLLELVVLVHSVRFRS